MRAMVLNGTKMACYDQISLTVKKSGMVPAGIATQFISAFGAGFFMTCTVAPFDMVRTKLMNQPPDAKMYSGFVDCFTKILKSGGPGALYAGFQYLISFIVTTIISLFTIKGVTILSVSYILLSLIGITVFYWLINKKGA